MSRKRKIPLGSPVIIDTTNSKYNLNNESTKYIALMPEGVVTSYCNEFSGQSLIIRLRSNIEIKVSEKELSKCTINYYFPDKINSSNLLKYIKDFIKIKFQLTGNRKIKYLLNPLSFLRWVNYTIKDVL